MGALSNWLLEAAPAGARRSLSQIPHLEQRLRELLETARTGWPTLAVKDEDFLRYLGARLPQNHLASAALHAMNVADLFLACACALGVPGAVVLLDRRYLSGLGVALERSLRLSPGFVDDVQQALREKLFLAQGDKPARILAYSGRGSLASWLKSAAIRTALNLRPSFGYEPLDEALAETTSGADDQELQVLKSRFRRELKHAFEGAVRQSSAEELEWLRLNLIEGMSIDKLAEVYGVSRATAARRLAAARKRLMDFTQKQLVDRLGLSTREVRSVVGLVRSQIDLSLHRHLGAKD